MPRSIVIATLLLAFTLIAPVGNVEGKDPLTAILNKVANSIVAIHNRDRSIYCSGFVIDHERQYVQSAFHCIDGAESHNLEVLVDGQDVTLLYADRKLDLVVMRTKTSKPALIAAQRNTGPGNIVHAIGHAQGLQHMTFRSGLTLATDSRLGQFALQPILIGGMSGGPIVNSQGEVVGIVQGGYRGKGYDVDLSVSIVKMLDVEAGLWAERK